MRLVFLAGLMGIWFPLAAFMNGWTGQKRPFPGKLCVPPFGKNLTTRRRLLTNLPVSICPPQTAVTGSLWTAVAAGIGAAGVLLAFFLLVAGILPLNRQVQSLEQAVMVLAEQTAVNTAVCPNPNLRVLSPVDGDAFSLGTAVPIIGAANIPEAARYRLEVRLAGTTDWLLVDDWTRDEPLNTLAAWDTTPHRSGTYEMRITAVDRNNIQLATATPCQLTIELNP
jgi:hypothetical protein